MIISCFAFVSINCNFNRNLKINSLYVFSLLNEIQDMTKNYCQTHQTRHGFTALLHNQKVQLTKSWRHNNSAFHSNCKSMTRF